MDLVAFEALRSKKLIVFFNAFPGFSQDFRTQDVGPGHQVRARGRAITAQSLTITFLSVHFQVGHPSLPLAAGGPWKVASFHVFCLLSSCSSSAARPRLDVKKPREGLGLGHLPQAATGC